MIQLNETFFNQPMWKEDRVYSKAEIWLCFLKEADKPLQDIIDGDVKLEIGKGRFYTSYKALAYSFRWTTPKITKYINTLKDHGIINIEPIKKTKSIVIEVKEIRDKYAKDFADKTTVELVLNTRVRGNKPKRERKGEPIFDFGKYNGLRISKCKDLQYLKWVYRNVDLDDFMQFAIEKQVDKLEGY